MHDYPLRPTRAEINLDNLAFNLSELKKDIGSETKILAAVKADGYGHGAVVIAREALANGVSYLGVAMVEEGVQLRKAGIKAPILILGATVEKQVSLLFTFDLIPTVFSLEMVQVLFQEAMQRDVTLPVHVKFDTGMGRLGVNNIEEALELIGRIHRLPSLKLEGLFSHYSTADEEDQSFTFIQLSKFMRLIGILEKEGINIPLKHIANSAATMQQDPKDLFDMVRIGISLYGYFPSLEMKEKEILKLKPLMTLKSEVVFIKELAIDEPVSYGRTFIAKKNNTLVATVPVGYGDGYKRALSNKGHVVIRGQRLPVIGRVCMDQILVDITESPTIKVGDEVILYGGQGNALISVDEIANDLGTISYEIISTIDSRVPRVYKKNGKVVEVRNQLYV